MNGANSVADPGCLSLSWIFPIPDPVKMAPDLYQQKSLSIFNPRKIVTRLSEIWSTMFIPDADFFARIWIFPFRIRVLDPWVKKH